MPAGQRDRLEHLYRYVARPTIATERFSLAADGAIRSEGKGRGTVYLAAERRAAVAS